VSADRLEVPRLTSRSGKLWGLGTLVVVVAVLGYLAVTQPQNRWAVLVVVPLAVLLVAFLLVRRTWVETGTGVVVSRTLLRTRRVPLSKARPLELVSNRGGGVLLRVGGPHASAYLPVLALTDYVEASQPAHVLLALAEQIDRWAPQGARTASQLRRQADHVAAGGDARRSPLAVLVTRGVINAAKGGGAAGGTSVLG